MSTPIMQTPILLIDDDPQLCDLLTDYLTTQHFTPKAVYSGEQALAMLTQKSFACDAIVLDIMMPHMSGLELLQILRKEKGITTPIIMLTGRGDDIDRIVGLEMGADDYMGKPCNPRELAARLRAVMRRREITPTVNAAPNIHGIELDASTLAASCHNQALHLTGAEFHVLQCLLVGAGQLLSKAHLTQQALHRDYTQYDRSIDVHVSRIRHKLAACGVADVIRSVRGQGYQMLMPDSP